MPCLPIGSMNGLSYAQLMKYSNAASIFKRVEAFNLSVKTLRTAGNLAATYYVFANSDEEANYKLGQFVLTQNDPVGAAAGTYIAVQKT